MATETCSLDDMIAASTCFLCLNPLERQAVTVWLLAMGLQAAGGGNYTNVNTLQNAAKCINCGPTDNQMQAYNVAIDQNFAEMQGAAVDLPIAQLQAAAKCFACLGMKTLQGMETFLRCNISNLIGGGGACSAQEGEDAPLGSFTPDFIGQLYHETGDDTYWRSTGLTPGDWVEISSAPVVCGDIQLSGSPVGVVTPEFLGQLYVDTDGPTYWFSTGATDADWQEIGGVCMNLEGSGPPT